MSASSARCFVPRSVLVAVFAALASCTDAATLMMKMKDNTILRPKGAVDAVDSTATTAMKNDSQSLLFGNQNYSNVANITDAAEDDDGTSSGVDEEALSAVWYLAAFGGLVLFFFVVTCSELFFGNPIYTRRAVELPHAGYLRRHVYGIRNHQNRVGGHYAPETPPPPYHLFAPPSYDDTVKVAAGSRPPPQQPSKSQQYHREPGTKQLQQTNVYVVPVHCATAAAGHAVAAASDAKLLAVVISK